MSSRSSIVVAPLEQRPPRRRRFDSPPRYESNPHPLLNQDQTDFSMNFTERGSPHARSSSVLTDASWSFQPPSGQDAFSPPTSQERIVCNAAPMIPLDAIFSLQNIPPEQTGTSTSDVLQFGDMFDEDDDVPLPAFGTSPRRAFSLLQERDQRFGNRHRKLTAPRVAAPPALLLYETAIDKSGSSQQDLPVALAPSRARYLPLVVAQGSSSRSTALSEIPKYTIEHAEKDSITPRRTFASQALWIPNEMPVELFEAITQYLSRDDIKAMRLVNKEFERGVSRSLFDTVVVPFNTELYDMIEQDKTLKRDLKGKGRADDSSRAFVDLIPGSLQWKNAMDDKEDKVYKGHGLRVFEGFGSHIRRFGMSFEVKEDALRNAPQKNALHQLDSYFGSYDWPSIEYTRFEKLAGLERTADETSQMKVAFSHLDKVRHLALCIDSGLGWMNAEDKSIRSQILQHAPPVFGGCSYGNIEAQHQERAKLWHALENAYINAGRLDELKTGCLRHLDLNSDLHNLHGLTGTSFSDTDSWAIVDPDVIDKILYGTVNVSERNTALATGVLLVQPVVSEQADGSEQAIAENDRPSPSSPQWSRESATLPTYLDPRTPSQPKPTPPRQRFSPAHLDKHQKEWLLEAEWAQRAFLMSYMLAIVDNSGVFGNIITLNLARISSHMLPLFYRHDFWEALPSLGDFSLGVIPDWRTVERDEAGFVDAKDVEPSKAVEGAFVLLKTFVGPRLSVKKIRFGWVAGGENAEGCLSRNAHILPAPITLLPHSIRDHTSDGAMLHLPHVEHLILSNCWVSPPAIINLVKNLEMESLNRITLDSVSLIALPQASNPNPNGGNQNFPVFNHLGMGVGQAGLPPGFGAQAPAPLPTPPMAQQITNQFWQGPEAGQPHGPWAQALLQQMQHMMTLHSLQHHHLHQMWSTHPAGMTLGQITHTLTMLAAGGFGVPGLFGGAGQAAAGPANHFNAVGAAPGLANAFPGRLAALFPATMPPGAFAPTMFLPPPPPSGNQQWYEGHREGSWPYVVDILSPGPRLAMYRPRIEFDPPVEQRETPLLSIEFRSCGYIRLPNATFDQTMLDNPAVSRSDTENYFQRRMATLSSSMLSSTDRYLGRIIQYMPEPEQDALKFAWDMRIGWDDEDKAREAEYDGYLPGGTGRFSGIVTHNSPLGDAAERST